MEKSLTKDFSHNLMTIFDGHHNGFVDETLLMNVSDVTDNVLS